MHNKCIYGQHIQVCITLTIPPNMNIHVYGQMINTEILDSCSLVNNNIGVFTITKDIGIEGELQVIDYNLYLIKAPVFPPTEGYTRALVEEVDEEAHIVSSLESLDVIVESD